MAESFLNRDDLIYREMMTHMPLFAHRNPQNVALWDHNHPDLGAEILKHPNVSSLWQVGGGTPEIVANPRVKIHPAGLLEFLNEIPPASLDILIIGNTLTSELSLCRKALKADGLFLQLCATSYDLAALKKQREQLKLVGFTDMLPVHFQEPREKFGWQAAMMACKEGMIKHPREKAIYNKTFSTLYYNLDMHKAAFALPEFMREEFA